MPELLDAVAGHYERRYGVHEHGKLSINSTQEGIAHIAMALCDAMWSLPNPGYPFFCRAILCGATPVTYDLRPEIISCRFDGISEEVAKKANL
ncbi:MAG: hypothetical protein ACLSFZ_11295 [Frisingicoccus sp.]